VRDRLARIAIENEVAGLLTQRTVWRNSRGELEGAEGSIAKVFATENYQRAARELQELAGPSGLLGFYTPGAAADGWIDHDARHSVPQTIQGGTSEINRNTIAERHLGLPRTR
jgi:alkylation response protein AidB-like acyl-CoA dehydrogenase